VKRREKQEEREKENDAPRYPNPHYGSWIEKEKDGVGVAI